MSSKRRESAVTELGRSMRRLSRGAGPVFVRYGRFAHGTAALRGPGGLLGETQRLIARAHRTWPPHHAAPPYEISDAELEASLRTLDAAGEVPELLATLAAVDLAYGSSGIDHDKARAAARRVTEVLGPDAVWFTNLDGDGSCGGEVTSYTFDGLIAGHSADHFAILLRGGED
ncbi:hypothetical protein [Streptomyces sp. ODS28]|uniref:hypothetical protein n=1 Tax=Streptomyces sp. ODS28 TaxID=3136688 RepID=UPI0031F13411